MAARKTAVSSPRINLLPRSEFARREREGITRAWMWVVLASIVVALLLIAGAFWLKSLADQHLAAEQARTSELLIQLSSLSDVSQALATESELTDFRTEAMATDLAWSPVIATIQSALPGDTRISGIELTVGGVPEGDDPALEAGLGGTVRIDSANPLDIVAIVRSLRAKESVLDADGQSVVSSNEETNRYSYLITVTFDQSVYSFAYAAGEEGGQ